jgi:hypothetical protein
MGGYHSYGGGSLILNPASTNADIWLDANELGSVATEVTSWTNSGSGTDFDSYENAGRFDVVAGPDGYGAVLQDTAGTSLKQGTTPATPSYDLGISIINKADLAAGGPGIVLGGYNDHALRYSTTANDLSTEKTLRGTLAVDVSGSVAGWNDWHAIVSGSRYFDRRVAATGQFDQFIRYGTGRNDYDLRITADTTISTAVVSLGNTNTGRDLIQRVGEQVRWHGTATAFEDAGIKEGHPSHWPI